MMNKLGAHICYPRGWGGMLRIGEAAPTVVKAFGDPGLGDLAALRDRVGSKCLLIVRFDLRNQQPLGAEHGHAFYARFRERMRAIARIAAPVAFEMYNEAPSEYAALLATTEAAWMEDMHRDGLRCVLGNWAVGNPQPEHAPFYAWVLHHMADGDLLGMHDYWAYTEDIENAWYVGRWRLPWQRAWMGDKAPIVITECGRDVIQDRAKHGKDPGRPGWKRTASLQEFVDDLRKYSRDVISDPRVVGSVIYQVGSLDDARWGAFESSEPLKYVVMGYRVPQEQPQPQPEPQPSPVLLPVPGARVSQRFGERPEVYGPTYAGHPGVDLAPPAGVSHLDWHGTPVRATVAGTAYVVRPDTSTGYGIYTYVKGDAADELVAHLAEANDNVNGKRVEPGDILGYAGYSGQCEPVGVRGCHVHWGKRPHPYQMGNGFRGYTDPTKC